VQKIAKALQNIKLALIRFNNEKGKYKYDEDWSIMNKLTIFLALAFISLAFASANLGTFQQSSCVNIVTNLNVSSVTLDGVTGPTSIVYIINTPMQKQGNYFNYSFCNTSNIGTYTYGYTDSATNSYSNSFDITGTGDGSDTNQGYMILALIGVMAIFTAIGFSFSKDKWKIRTFFFMAALSMGIVLLNSLRIIAGTSSKLNQMANIGLIVGITILSFMFLYMLIFYTIETFKYFKEKRRMRWEVSGP